jgi:hypothetical protein
MHACGLFWLRFTYVTPILVTESRGWKRLDRLQTHVVGSGSTIVGGQGLRYRTRQSRELQDRAEREGVTEVG